MENFLLNEEVYPTGELTNFARNLGDVSPRTVTAIMYEEKGISLKVSGYASWFAPKDLVKRSGAKGFIISFLLERIGDVQRKEF